MFIILFKKKIEVSLSVEPVKRQEGNNKEFNIYVENKGLIPVRKAIIYLKYSEDSNDNKKKPKIKKIYFSITSKERQAISCSICTDGYGIIDVDVFKIKLFDPYGITFLSKKIDQNIKLLSMPDLSSSSEAKNKIIKSNIKEHDDSFENIEYSNKYISNSSEISDFSIYKPGDNVRRINWKLSAKKNQLLVKNYKSTTNMNGLIIIENILNRNETYEKILDSTLFVSLDMIKNNVNHYIVWFDSNLDEYVKEKITNENNAYSCIKHILESNIISEGINGINYLKNDNYNYSNIYYITSRHDKEINSGLLSNVNVIQIEEEEKNKVENEAIFNDEIELESGKNKKHTFANLFDGLFIAAFLCGFIECILVILDIKYRLDASRFIFFAATVVIYMDIFINALLVNGLLKFLLNKRKFARAIIVSVLMTISWIPFLRSIKNGFPVFYDLIFKKIDRVNSFEYFDLNGFAIFLMFLIFIIIIIMNILSRFKKENILKIILLVPIICSNIYFEEKISWFAFSLMIMSIIYSSFIHHKMTLKDKVFKCRKNKYYLVSNKYYKQKASAIGLPLILISVIIFISLRIFFNPSFVADSTKISNIRFQCKNAFLNDKEIQDAYNYIFYGKATGGLNRGKLGNINKIEYDNTTHLKVTLNRNMLIGNSAREYFKGYTGDEYTGSRFKEDNSKSFNKYLSEANFESKDVMYADYNYSEAIRQLIKKISVDDIDDAFIKELYGPGFYDYYKNMDDKEKYQSIFSGYINSEVNVQNIAADSKYIYRPYTSVIQNSDEVSIINDMYISPKGNLKKYTFDSYIGKEQYSIVFGKLIKNEVKDKDEELKKIEEIEKSYTDFVHQEYIKLPDKGLDEIKEKYKKENIDPYNYGVYIRQVIQDIQADTEYSLEPGKTPKNKDFVEYFLYENKKGYCVHYAAAATVILRAMGIPARYVEGYCLSNNNTGDYSMDCSINALSIDNEGSGDIPCDGMTYSLKDSDVHAWVEVFIDNYGWTPIEVTKTMTDSAPYDAINEENNQDDSDITTKNSFENNEDSLKDENTTEEVLLAENVLDKQDDKNDKNDKIIIILIVLISFILVGSVLRFVCIRLNRKRSFCNKDNHKAIISMTKYFIAILKFKKVNINGLSYQELIMSIKEKLEYIDEKNLVCATKIMYKAKFGKNNLQKNDKDLLYQFIINFSKDFYHELSFCDKIKFKVISIL